jgi:hypothetical protein
MIMNKENGKQTNRTNYRKLMAEPIKARTNRLRRHNEILNYVIAGLLGASTALIFVIIHMMVTGPAWTW